MPTTSKSKSQDGKKRKPTLNSIYASFGGFHQFLLSYGLKPYNHDDVEEGVRIAQVMLEGDLEEWEEGLKIWRLESKRHVCTSFKEVLRETKGLCLMVFWDVCACVLITTPG